MKLFSKKYNERALRIERFILKNKLFLMIAVILTVFLIGNEVRSNTKEEPVQQIIQIQETDESEKDETQHWRFYSIDAWILLVGGGFCSIMIVRERRKAKEKLN